jgi:hypothetical protein
MPARIARSWFALRYDLSSQRALDNANRNLVEHERLLAEIDALARRIDAATAPAPAVEQREPPRPPAPRGTAADRLAS